MKSIEFSEKSELKSIGEYAFVHNAISGIVLPHKLQFIKTFAFMRCEKLKVLEVPIINELKFIHKDAFHCSGAQIIFGPPGLESVYRKD